MIPLVKKMTNNGVEYEACIFGLEALLTIGVKNVEVYGESMLVIHQASGSWDVREDILSYIMST